MSSSVRHLWLALLVVVAGALSATAAEERVPLPENPHALDRNRACGLYCLSLLNSMLGGDETYAKIAQLCPPGPQGVSMEDLRRAAEEMGLHARGVKVSLSELKQLPYSAILHLDQVDELDHFVAWIRWDEEQQAGYVFSPPGQLEYRKPGTLSRYSGIALLIDRNPIPEKLIVQSAWAETQVWLLGGILVCLLGVLVSLVRNPASQPVASGATPAVIVLVCGFLVLSGCQRSPVSSQTGDDRRDVDLGILTVGTDMQHTYVIRNTTDKPLKITGLEKSCNCQSTKTKIGTVIPSGESLEVPYTVPAKGLKGVHTGRLTLTTDAQDESLSRIVFTLKGEIPDSLKAIPSQVIFGVVPVDRPAERLIRVESIVPGLTEKFQEASSSNHLVNIQREKTSPGELVLKVTLPPAAPVGDIHDIIRIHFDDEIYPTLLVDVRAQKVGDYQTIPKTVYFSRSAGDQPQKRRVRIKSTDGQPFDILRVDCRSDIIVDPVIANAQSSYDLNLELQSSPGDIEPKFITVHPNRGSPIRIAINWTGQPQGKGNSTAEAVSKE